MGQYIAAFLAAMGIPSAVMGVFVWRVERRITEREKAAREHEMAKEKLMVNLVESTNAALALCEATAKAVQRIPDAHCNGDMTRALEYAVGVKHRQKEFLIEQGIQALVDD